MISNVYIDGFKSLVDFEMGINEGLNVLVGPNGVGKSNICQALVLAGHVRKGTVAEYVLSLGGTNSVFKLGGGRSIKAKIEGFAVDYDDKPNYVRYEYEFQISVGERLSIDGETLTLYVRSNKTNRYRRVLRANRGVSEKGVNNSVFVEIFDFELIGPSAQFVKKYKEKKISGSLRSEDDSIFSFLEPTIYFCFLVGEDISDIDVINIDPSKARLPSDVTEGVRIASNGARLANALYELSKDDDALSEVNSFFSRLFPDFCRISYRTVNNFRSVIVSGNGGEEIPSSGLSDGTLKIICLLVHLVSKNAGTLIVEEPENYLHPFAVEEVIDKIRSKGGVFNSIITTHSETVLNLIDPQEVAVCNRDGLRTSLERIGDVTELKSVISETGFGCGYFYTRGALGGVPCQ